MRQSEFRTAPSAAVQLLSSTRWTDFVVGACRPSRHECCFYSWSAVTGRRSWGQRGGARRSQPSVSGPGGWLLVRVCPRHASRPRGICWSVCTFRSVLIVLLLWLSCQLHTYSIHRFDVCAWEQFFWNNMCVEQCYKQAAQMNRMTTGTQIITASLWWWHLMLAVLWWT